MRVRGIALAGPAPLLMLVAVNAHAQSQSRDIGSTAPSVYADDKEYRQQPLRLGALAVSLGAEARVEYDDNVYAEPVIKKDDIRFELLPRLKISTPPGPVSAQINASSSIRRFAQLTSENTVGWYTDGIVRWAPNASSVGTAQVFYQRSIEDRGDPETNIGSQFGPRRTDSLGADLRYRRDSGHILVDLETSITKYDALALRDANRDFNNYMGRATFGLRTTPTVFVTGTLFASRRDFRLDLTTSGVKRNSNTFGARLGVDIQPGGLLEGNLSVGAFRFDPDDPQTKGRTGVSIAGSMIYRPRRRTAILLNAFSGDAATFRNGAQQRTDTSFKLSLQQEIRHDLFATPSFGYRETKYNGSGDKQRTFTVGGELEYVMSRHLSIAAIATYGDRDSDDDPSVNFKRLRAGISLRGRF